MSTPLPGPGRQTSPLAITSLVFGLLGFLLLPVIGSLVAIVTGHLARSEIRRTPQRFEGDGLAVAGLALGYVAIGLGLLTLLVALVFVGGLFALIAATS